MVQTRETRSNSLHPLGYKIFLDRYAQKDMTRSTLTVGDTVIVVVDSKTGQREIGTIKAIELPKITIELTDGEIVTRDIEHVDKPLETDPGQMMDRVARGVAEIEATPELREAWAEKFRWALDDWKFVPAGRILAAAGTEQELTYYNCMPPEQEVLTAEGYKPIAEIKVGDLVVTHRNRLRPVRHKMERETEELLYIIKPKKLSYDDLRVTGDHKIYAIRAEWVNKHKSRDGLRLKQTPDWIPAKDLRPGDYVAAAYNGEECPPEPIYISDHIEGYAVQDGRLSKPTTRGYHGYVSDWGTHYALNNTLEVDGQLCYLFGRWLGDGCVNHRSGTDIPSGIKIVFGLDERAEAEEIARIIEAKFGVEPSLKLSSTERWYDLWVNSMPLGQFFKAFFGAYSYAKHIPAQLMNLPEHLTLELLRGIFSADGYTSNKYLGILLANRVLTTQMHQLLLRLGYFFSIRENTHRLGRIPAYRLTAAVSECEPLFAYFFGKAAPANETVLKYHLDYDDLKWVRIDQIAVEDYSGVVMDIEVEEDHSFVSAGIVVSNCYVIPSPKDSRGGIINTLHQMTEIMSRGGGVGINISSLRPRHSYVKGVNGRSSGSVSWGALYSFVTGLIEQGGSRRGALMIILNDWHPDIYDFINSKRTAGQITNANISVNVSDKFMDAVKNDADWELVFPDTSYEDYDTAWDGDIDKWRAAGRRVQHYRTVKARDVWNAIIESAWASAEPGVWFGERSNKMSNSHYFSPLICTNPCVTGDTLVATEWGNTKARDLQPGMKIRTPAGLKPIEKVYNNGVQKIFRVEFSDGGHLECTADHKLKVVRGKKYEWVAVSELLTGDRVLVAPNESFGSTRRLPEKAIAYIQKRSLNVPEFFDRTLGFLAGVTIGDGNLRVSDTNDHSCTISFGTHEQDWLGVVEQTLTNIGIHHSHRLSAKNIARPDGTVVVHQSQRLISGVLGNLLVKLGLPANIKAPYKTLPEAFLALDREFLAGVLDGLFSTDGNVHVKRDNPMLRFTTSSYQLAQQVRLLLLQFGIHARIYTQKRDSSLEYDGRSMAGTGVKYDVVIMNEGIARFYSEIGLAHPRKAERLKDIVENWHYNGGTWVASVVSVEDTGREEEVYDVYEPHTLTWVTNGYVSFDCGEQSLPAFGVCNLGAINLAKFYDADTHDVKWDELDQTVRYATRFLDNVIDSTPYFFEENREQQLGERRVGLNNMGLAELMIRLGIRYGSDESVKFIDKLYSFIARASYETSIELAQEKGAFPNFDGKKFVQSGFMKSMPKDIRDKAKKHGIRNVTLLTQAPTGCVAPDTLVSTATGLRPIVEMGDPNGDQWQPIDTVVHTDLGLRQASRFFVNGHREVIKLKTKRGFSVTATPNHRLRVIDASGDYVWRRMDEMQIGDRVVLKKDTLQANEIVELTPVEQGTSSMSRLPRQMTPELAELLGLYMGDGYAKKRGGLHIVVSQQDPDLLVHVQDLMRDVWEDRHIGIEERPGCWTANLTGYYIPRFFEANGLLKQAGNHGEGAAAAFIPTRVLQAGRACVAAFLRGLFESDGSISRGTITLVSTSPTLISQAQIALLGLGIVATVREMPQSSQRYGTRTLHELRILNRRECEKFVQIVGFISQRKQQRAADLGSVSDRGDSIDSLPLREEFYAKSKGLQNEVRQRMIGLVSNGALTQQFVRDMVSTYPMLKDSRLGQLVEMGVFIDEVASLEDSECDTYDLSVPANETYIANGFISHNTTGTMVNTSTGIEPFFSWVYYRKSRLGLHEEQVPIVQEYFDKNPGETELPDYFVTAMDLSPEDHVRVQAAIQRWVDSSISKCVVGDTLVLTTEGLKRIEGISELRDPDTFEDTDVDVLTSNGRAKAKAFYYNGIRNTLKLTLSYGFEIEGTPNHPIRVLESDGSIVFKPLSDIQVGDTLPMYKGQRAFGSSNKPLPAYTGKWNVTNTKQICIPDHMTDEFAFLLGCITSEGNISSNGVGFVNSDRNLVERVANLFDALFGIKCIIEQDKRRESLWHIRANSRILRNWIINDLGMLPGASHKIIPDCILEASEREIGYFLRGLFLDAYMTLNGKMFGIGLASQKLLKQLQVLFLNFGIIARIHQAGPRAWALTVAGDDLNKLALITGFEEVWKNERIAKRNENRQMKMRSYSTMLPEQISAELYHAAKANKTSLRSLYAGQPENYQRVRVALMRSTKIRRDDAQAVYQHFADTVTPFLNRFFADDTEQCLYVEVKAIKAGFAEVFDISVPEGHEFIANGICNHNTSNLPNSYTVEQTRILYEYMYELGCKGGTIYRDGSRDEQVLMLKGDERAESEAEKIKAAKPAEDKQSVEQVATPHRIYPRPSKLSGVTVSYRTPFGTAYITMNSDENGNPFEVFITAPGKAGSDLQADAEGLGRLISLQLRSVAPANRRQMLRLIIDQLQGIGGSRSIGMGPSRVMSLPDAVAGALLDNYFTEENVHQLGLPINGGSIPVISANASEQTADNGHSFGEISGADLCPSCGTISLIRAEGCRKCLTCGYSEC